MDKIAEFVLRKRVIEKPQTPQFMMEEVKVKEVKAKEVKVEEPKSSLPWFKRPIVRRAFKGRKGKDGKLYIHHEEWSKRIWIGPYDTMAAANIIVNKYVIASMGGALRAAKDSDEIHSLIVEDEEAFFADTKLLNV